MIRFLCGILAHFLQTVSSNTQRGSAGIYRPAAPNANGIVATCHDGVSTGLDWQYYNRLHIGATAWYLFAERQYNPFWGIQTDMPVPYAGE